MRLHGAQQGIGSHQPSLKRSFDEAISNGVRLGNGAHGAVYVNPGDSMEAIKGQQRRPAIQGRDVDHLLRRTGIEREVDIQARLGNELGLMPRLNTVETVIDDPGNAVRAPRASVYMGMENLAPRGFVTLETLEKSESLSPEDYAQLLAEKALAEAWAARAGIEVNDSHSDNAMVLPPGVQSVEPDESRLKLIDAGMYQSIGNRPRLALQAQADAMAKGYSSIGLSHMGSILRQVVTELATDGDFDHARHVVSQGLSDLAARASSIDRGALERNRLATEKMRMAGDVLGVNPATVAQP